ncbi:MAG: hemerythrin domain-containing protein [Dehalococcoidia bacterium]|nr:hemerythrin domain-containing protein [Dehalococcoidia bacterium]
MAMNRLPTPEELPEPLAGLLRDHEHTAVVIAGARATFDGARLDGPGAAARVVEVARDLQRFLAEDLTLHIAKEEDVLFPALRSLADGIDDAILHMVAQHDEIRARQDLIDRTMAALDAHHHEVEEERDAFISEVMATTAALTPAVLEDLRERAMRMERILLGHFADEEEDLFVPARALLAPEVMQSLAARTTAMDRPGPPA